MSFSPSEILEITLEVSGLKDYTALAKVLCVSRTTLYEMRCDNRLSFPIRQRIFKLYPQVGAEALLMCGDQ